MSFLMYSTRFTQVEAAPLLASPCTLTWNDSLGASVAGYALYYGITSSGVTNRFDARTNNSVTFYKLLVSSNYFFYAVTYNNSGMESPRSEVTHYIPRALSALKMTRPAGAALSLLFQAAPGSVCRIEYTPSIAPPQWQTLGGATADIKGNVTITDPLTGNPPRRFYRAAVP